MQYRRTTRIKKHLVDDHSLTFAGEVHGGSQEEGLAHGVSMAGDTSDDDVTSLLLRAHPHPRDLCSPSRSHKSRSPRSKASTFVKHGTSEDRTFKSTYISSSSSSSSSKPRVFALPSTLDTVPIPLHPLFLCYVPPGLLVPDEPLTRSIHVLAFPPASVSSSLLIANGLVILILFIIKEMKAQSLRFASSLAFVEGRLATLSGDIFGVVNEVVNLKKNLTDCM